MYSLAKVFLSQKLLKSLRVAFRTQSYSQNINLRKYSLEKLEERGFLRVHGKESAEFLQGLVTNDMRHLEEGAQSMYTMFLNIRGRVMCETIIYQDEDETFLLEGDKEALQSLQKHLKMYRVRKKIDIDLIDDFNLWVMYLKKHLLEESNIEVPSMSSKDLQIDSENDTRILDSMSETFQHSKIICRDPRLSELGYRLIVPRGEDLLKGTERLHENEVLKGDYKKLRYKLGVGEGVAELPPGKCFPLELNCDFLHGVSFHKGCYIGQELTARVHHTGVVRKRLMPIILNSEPTESFVLDAQVENILNKKAVGKLRGLENRYGLGLLKVTEALSAPALGVLNTTGFAWRPSWWPLEAPKERSSVEKGVQADITPS